MLRASIMGVCALGFLGAWTWVLPPSTDNETARRADGSMITDGQQVTRAAPRTSVLPLPSVTDLAEMDRTVETVLDGLGIPKHDSDAVQFVAMQHTSDPLANHVTRALRDRQGNAAIEAVINAAYARAELDVPDVLITAKGTVDTNTLLSLILTRANARLGEADTTLGYEIVSYVVQPDDSLASIALYAFGDAWQAPRLIAANRSSLPSAAALYTGQVLVIPSD